MNKENYVNIYTISLTNLLTISFQRTLRIPEAGGDYPLPPSLGAFPIYQAVNYLETPAQWRAAGDLFIPMYQREAMWIGLRTIQQEPCAVQIGVGNINAITGMEWNHLLNGVLQNYLVCPQQPWLDGFNTGDGVIRQFVAVHIGSGESVESQVAPQEAGGLRVAVFAHKAGFVPVAEEDQATPQLNVGMAMAAGGRMQQKIYVDPYGVDSWEPNPAATARIHIVDSLEFRKLTGEEPPPTLVTAERYTEYGLPWFALYDEDEKTVAGAGRLKDVRTLGELDKQRNQEPDTHPIDIPDEQIRKLRHKSGRVS